jgi:pSer/pThr/pTyr-binding forkhead associated (FHA) protein
VEGSAGSIEYLDVQTRRGARRLVLEQDILAIGRSDANGLVLGDDASVSRAHAMLERLPAGWAIRDLGSRNGTFVNDRRIRADHVLHPGDQIRVGAAHLTFRQAPSRPGEHTVSPDRTPELTRRERDVLEQLCRPAATGDVFTEPASIRDIAAALFVTEAAVKQHLGNLYEKFDISGEGERRRTRLANEAVRRGVVTIAAITASMDTDAGGA